MAANTPQLLAGRHRPETWSARARCERWEGAVSTTRVGRAEAGGLKLLAASWPPRFGGGVCGRRKGWHAGVWRGAKYCKE